MQSRLVHSNCINEHHRKDGGLSTEDTVRDGGEDEAEHDPDFKPS